MKRLYRISQLVGSKADPGIVPVNASTIWRWVSTGRFPKPFKIGDKTTVWDADSVDAWAQAAQQPTANQSAHK